MSATVSSARPRRPPMRWPVPGSLVALAAPAGPGTGLVSDASGRAEPPLTDPRRSAVVRDLACRGGSGRGRPPGSPTARRCRPPCSARSSAVSRAVRDLSAVDRAVQDLGPGRPSRTTRSLSEPTAPFSRSAPVARSRPPPPPRSSDRRATAMSTALIPPSATSAAADPAVGDLAEPTMPSARSAARAPPAVGHRGRADGPGSQVGSQGDLPVRDLPSTNDGVAAAGRPPSPAR